MLCVWETKRNRNEVKEPNEGGLINLEEMGREVMFPWFNVLVDKYVGNAITAWQLGMSTYMYFVRIQWCVVGQIICSE